MQYTLRMFLTRMIEVFIRCGRGTLTEEERKALRLIAIESGSVPYTVFSHHVVEAFRRAVAGSLLASNDLVVANLSREETGAFLFERAGERLYATLASNFEGDFREGVRVVIGVIRNFEKYAREGGTRISAEAAKDLDQGLASLETSRAITAGIFLAHRATKPSLSQA